MLPATPARDDERHQAPAPTIPWFVWCTVVAVTAALVAGHADGAVGRDGHFSAPHAALYLCGVLASVCSAWLLHTAPVDRDHALAPSPASRGPFPHAGALVVALLMLAMLEHSNARGLQAARLQRDVALALPLVLVGISRAAPHPGACTIMAAIYSLFLLGAAWTLPLFSAATTLGSGQLEVTHVVPAALPLLLSAPALALDGLRRVSPRRGLWRETLATTMLFLATLAIVQWPSATFLRSP